MQLFLLHRTPSNVPTCDNTRQTLQHTRRRADLSCDEQSGLIQDTATLGHLHMRQIQLFALPSRECRHSGRHLAALDMRCAVAKATCGLPLHTPTFIFSRASVAHRSHDVVPLQCWHLK